jgi:hypothetical protein
MKISPSVMQPEHRRNMEDFINMLRGVEPNRFAMAEFSRNACCIATWFFRFHNGKADPSTLLGIPSSRWVDLCLMDRDFNMVEFDARTPDEQRKAVMLRVLEQYLEKGYHVWAEAMVEVLGEEKAAELLTSKDWAAVAEAS